MDRNKLLGIQDVYLGQPTGYFRSQDLNNSDPNAVEEIRDMKDTKRAMLPLALANMMSSNRGQQNFGNRLYAEASQGLDPMKLANGYVMDDGTYITDQDPSANIRAQAALIGQMNRAHGGGGGGGGGMGYGSVTQIGTSPDGTAVFKGKGPQLFTYGDNGPTPYVGGFDAKGAGHTTEDENKSAGYYKRILNGQKIVKDITAVNPSAATQSFVPRYAEKIPYIGDDIGSALTSQDRLSVEAAQLDMLDAALTLNTGAAYTKEQLKGLTKSYFPQPNDSSQTIKTKETILNGLIDSAKIRAGRALKQSGGQGSGQTPGVGAAPHAGVMDDPLGMFSK